MSYIVLDIDGTLYNSKHEISPQTKEILIQLQRDGHHLILASGRDVENLKVIGRQLKMDRDPKSYLIGVNGLQIYQYATDELKESNKFNHQQKETLLSVAKKLNVSVFVFGDYYKLKYRPPLYAFFYKIRRFFLGKANNNGYEGKMDGIIDIDQVDYKFEGDIRKFALIMKSFPTMRLKQFKKQLNEDYSYLWVGKGWIEVMLPGIDKGIALESVLKQESIDFDDVFVFGDSANDEGMLSLVKHSYAMGNARKGAKLVASQVIKSNDEEGIYEMLKSLVVENKLKRQ